MSGGGVGAGVLVGGDGALALAGAYGHGDDLGVVAPLGHGAGGAGLGAQGQGVLVGAADGVGAAQVLRGLDHAAGHGVVDAARGDPAAREGVVQLEAGALDAPAAVVGVVGGGAHHVDATRHDDVAEAGPDLHGGVEDGLEPGAAAAVGLQTGDGLGQPGVQRDDPAEGRGLGGGVGVAEDHLVDPFRVDPGTGDDLGDDAGGEGRGRLLGEGSAEPPDGGAQRFADDDIGLVGHGGTPFGGSGVWGDLRTRPMSRSNIELAPFPDVRRLNRRGGGSAGLPRRRRGRPAGRRRGCRGARPARPDGGRAGRRAAGRPVRPAGCGGRRTR